MARDVESLVLLMSADVRRLEKQLSQGQRSFDKAADAIERRQRQLDKNLSKLGSEVGNFARPAQLAATVALGAITAMSYQAAKRAEAVNGAFSQTFRDMPKEAAAATAAITSEFGRLETDVKENFTQLRSVLTALGVDAQQSLIIVDQLQRRSLDIGAFANVSDADAFRAVISGITGETEPLKRFGVVVNETATKAELLRLGFKGNATEASEAAKSIARANIIMRQSAEMHGQVARESNTLAEQEKRTRAEFTKAAEDFGRTFLPVAGKVLQWASDALEAFNNLPSGVQAAGLALLAFTAAAGPIGAAITGLRALIGAAVAARTALAAVSASGAAGAAARGAAGVGAAALGATGAAIGSTLALSGDTRAPSRTLQEQVNNGLREESRLRAEIGRLTASGNTAEAARQSAYLGRVQGRRERNQGLLEIGRPRTSSEAAAAAQREADAAASSALAGLGDFGLSAAQKAAAGGSGGGGGGGRAAAAAADRLADAREALVLEEDIARARATGDEAAVRAAEERETRARLIQQYESAGYADADARATQQLALINQATALTEEREAAEKAVDIILEGRAKQLEREADYAQTIKDQLFDRLGYEAELARVTGNEGAIRAAERRLFIEERTLEILRLKLAATEAEARAMAGGEFDTLAAAETGRDVAGGIVSLLRSDNVWEEAGQRFKNAAWDGVEDLISKLFSSMDGGKGGGIAGIIGSLFGSKGFAAGGYTGSGGKNDAAGVVHRGEVVWSQADIARFGGVAAVEALRRGKGFANGGIVGARTVFPGLDAAMSRVSQGRGVAGGQQTVRVIVAPSDDRFDAYVDGRAVPAATRAAAQGTSFSRSQIPSDLTKTQTYRRGR